MGTVMTDKELTNEFLKSVFQMTYNIEKELNEDDENANAFAQKLVGKMKKRMKVLLLPEEPEEK